MADFFVSYTSADQRWAQWIGWQLRDAGHSVVLQAWDMGPGTDFVHEMQLAATTSRRTVVVLSPAYLSSQFGEAEWRVAFANDPSGEKGLLIPVRVANFQPPGLLKTRVYIDLVGKSRDEAQALLLNGIHGRQATLATEEPEFPIEGIPAAEVLDSAGDEPRFPGRLPRGWKLPFPRNWNFTGRDVILEALRAGFTSDQRPIQPQVIAGLGGVGKTQLALEYAHRYAADYDLVWWVPAEDGPTLVTKYLGLAPEIRIAQAAGQEGSVEAVRVWLERHDRWLLVFDNARDPKVLAPLLPRAGGGHVLITSQHGGDWGQLAAPVSLEPLPLADAAAFLLRRTGKREERAARELAEALGGLPLALEQAGALVAETGVLTLADYLDLFKEKSLTVLREGHQPAGDDHTLDTTWQLSLDRLKLDTPAAGELLRLVAFLAPDDLPWQLLTEHAAVLPASLQPTGEDRLALAKAVGALRRFSLVKVAEDGLFIHRLLQTFIRERLSEQAQASWAGAAVILVEASFPENSGDVPTWPQCRRLLPHLMVAVEHAREHNVEHEACSLLQNRATSYLASIVGGGVELVVRVGTSLII